MDLIDWTTPSSSLFLASTTNAAFALGVLVSGSKQPEWNGRSYFSLIFRIAGGAPDGIKRLAGESGCRMNRMTMRSTTVMGNSNTTPKGIDIDELPFTRTRRLRKANRGDC
jgi:hypothetical protein